MRKQKRQIFIFALAIAAGAALALVGGVAMADEAPAETPAQTLSEQNAAAEGDEGIVSIAGMTVFKDPETGQFRPPTSEEAAILAEAVGRLFGGSQEAAGSAASNRQESFAEGTVGVKLDLSQLAFSVATVGADGAIEHDCARTAQDALDHLHAPAAPAEDR